MADSTNGMTRFHAYAAPTGPLERLIAALAPRIPAGAADRLAGIFDGLPENDSQRIVDIVLEHAYRFWMHHDPVDDPNPEFNVLLRNRGACAVSRLDGIDWHDPDKASKALTTAADALQPNIIAVDLGMNKET